MQLPTTRGRVRKRDIVVADEATTHGIGPIFGEFHVYDRDRPVLQRLGDTRLLTSYLDEYGGIRVYRDGIRVYNYGEQGDDWLGLDLRRVNIPTRRISRNIILGAIHLSVDDSPALIEKTNREGFVENDALERLRHVVLAHLVRSRESGSSTSSGSADLRNNPATRWSTVWRRRSQSFARSLLATNSERRSNHMSTGSINSFTTCRRLCSPQVCPASTWPLYSTRWNVVFACFIKPLSKVET